MTIFDEAVVYVIPDFVVVADVAFVPAPVVDFEVPFAGFVTRLVVLTGFVRALVVVCSAVVVNFVVIVVLVACVVTVVSHAVVFAVVG